MCLTEADNGVLVERCGRLEVVFCVKRGSGVNTIATGTKTGNGDGIMGVCNNTFELLNQVTCI